MLQYEKANVWEGVDVNKTSLSEEYELCHNWFFKDIGFKFEEHFVMDTTIYWWWLIH